MICPNDSFKYFSSVEFETLGYHILSSIELPLHIFAGYIILCKTPAKMQSVKWALFNLHVWSASLDISISLLATPYILFPEITGYAFGVLAWLDVHPRYLTWFLVAQVGIMLNSMAVLYENRYSCLVRSSNFWRRARVAYLVVAYLVALFYIAPFMAEIPDEEYAVAETLKNLPEIRCVYDGPLFVFTLTPRVFGVVTMTKLIIEFLSMFTLVALTFRVLRGNSDSTLSENTLKMQRKFFITLMIQTSIPFVVVLLPLFYYVFSMTQNYFSQSINNVCLLVISSHGLVSTIAMLMLHPPYREFTLSVFRIRRKPKISVASNSQGSVK